MKANKFFTIRELVSRQTYDSYGDDSIRYLDKTALEALENVREILDVPLICNNWSAGGSRTQSGFRESTSSVGVAGSMHKQGKAFDLISPKMSSKQMWAILEEKEHLLIHPIRIERWDNKGEITWLHIDTKPFAKGNSKLKKIYFFKA